jgi:hypothetical protein
MATASIPYLPVGLTRDNFDALTAGANLEYLVPDVSATLVSIPLDIIALNANKLVLNLELQCDVSGASVFSLATALDVSPEVSTSYSRTFYSSATSGTLTCVWNTVLVKGVDYAESVGPVVVRITGPDGAGEPTLSVVSNGNAQEIRCSYSITVIP